jgi:cobalt-zinc-cadmium efflux system membrane fusion protein
VNDEPLPQRTFEESPHDMTYLPARYDSSRAMLWLVNAAVLTSAGGCGSFSRQPADHERPAVAAVTPEPAARAAARPGEPTVVEFPQESWQAAGIDIQPARVGRLDQLVAVTGKVMLNEDRVAHIFPLVDGRVNAVKVGLGDRVKKGQIMAIIQSREVGDSMLRLVQDRLQLSFALRKNEWVQAVAANSRTLIELLRANAPVEQVETEMRNKPLGEYREKLMTAYIANDTAKKNLDRLTPLQGQGIVAARQLFEAEAAWTTTRATLKSLLEQIEQDAHQAAILAAQHVEELQTRIVVDKTALRILGFADADIADIDPSRGEDLAHCPVHAPFDGTVVSKDVVLLEHVGPSNQILGIADLGSVWLTADIYEDQIPILREIEDATVSFRSAAWPDKTFTAKVFYTGDIVDAETRTVSMRAVADNAAGLLKPGMFVTVELPGSMQASIVQVPRSAILEHEGRSFVFVHSGGDVFESRQITVGRSTPQAAEITSGITSGENVVVAGGFALKSRMLADLLEE